MKEYRLNKRFILKMIITRLAFIVILNICYITFKHKAINIYSYYLIILMCLVNIVGFYISIISPFIEYLLFKYYISDNEIQIKYGAIFRKSVYLPIQNIKYIIIKKDPLDYLLRINKVKLYTTAGHRVIKSLDNEKAKELWNIMKDNKVEY